MLVLQVTPATPTLSAAVPWKTIESLEVETVPPPGEEIAKDGAVVSGVPPAGAVWRIT